MQRMGRYETTQRKEELKKEQQEAVALSADQVSTMTSSNTYTLDTHSNLKQEKLPTKSPSQSSFNSPPTSPSKSSSRAPSASPPKSLSKLQSTFPINQLLSKTHSNPPSTSSSKPPSKSPSKSPSWNEGGLVKVLSRMPNFSEGNFGVPGQIRGLSVGARFFEVEDYCSSFSILLGREKLA